MHKKEDLWVPLLQPLVYPRSYHLTVFQVLIHKTGVDTILSVQRQEAGENDLKFPSNF